MAASPATADLPSSGREQRTAVSEPAWHAHGVSETDAKLTIAQVLRLGAAAYVNKYRNRGACLNVQSVLAKLSLCRTRALGGHKYQCDACDSTCHLYNSCGDRHCSQCSGSKRYDFSERAGALLLDGIDYYQVVFTLPSELSQLALSNRESLADLLFRSAWKSLRKTIGSQQGYEPAAIMVLHTWNQHLDAHWHVHALVPGAGPGLDGRGWQVSRPPVGADNSEGNYLVDAISLRESFRKFAVAHLNRLRASGKLKLNLESAFGDLREDDAWTAFTEHLLSLDWVSFIQPPPGNSSGPSDLVRYLTRYLTGGPISDARILAADEHEVTFLARVGERQGGEKKQIPTTLSTLEFIRRWCLHIQPDQLTKTRYFGGWSNSRLAAYQDRSVREMNAAEVPLAAGGLEFLAADLDAEQHAAAEEPIDRRLRCPACGSDTLQEIASWPRPSWRDVFSRHSGTIPSWYAESMEDEDRRVWGVSVGTGFYDWYMETLVEGAYGSPPRRKFTQPLLPGFETSAREELHRLALAS